MQLDSKLLELIKMPGVNNMDILSITVGGFRNINSTKLDFNKFTALVGLNGYGKSNVMDAIDIGFSFIQFPANGKVSLMNSKENIPILRSFAGKNYSFSVEAKLESFHQSFMIQYSFSFAWGTDQKPAKILSENLRIKTAEKGQKYNLYITRDDLIAKYKSSVSGRCNKAIKIDSNSLVINKLLAIDDLYYLDILQQINNIQFFIERHLDASSSYMPAPFVIKGVQELELQGIQNIPRAMYFLKRDFPDKFELLINAFQQVFPNITNVHVQEIKLNDNPVINFSDDSPVIFTDSFYSMSVLDKGLIQPIRFENLSDGTKRIFLIMAFAVIADIKGLSMIAIEEPENSIHPNLLQSYVDILGQLVNNCKIIMTSHSPYILQYIDPRCIYIGKTSNENVVDFKRIAPSKINNLLRDAALYNSATI